MTDDELKAFAGQVFAHFDHREAANERSRRLKDWALSVFCWDGILPLVVFALPGCVKLLLPRWDFGIAFIAVFVPVSALSIRFTIGWQMMRRSQSYIWQTVLFTVSISALFLFEAFVLNDQIGNGPKIADPIVLLVMLLTYFALMSIALFPLRSPSPPRVN